MTHWIAVTHPSCERRASTHLAEMGYPNWFPTKDVQFKTRYMRKPASRAYPLFPGYVFVEAQGSHHVLRDAEGVRAVLCNNYRPLTVSDLELETLRKRCEAMRPADAAVFEVGNLVWVSSGPLGQLKGTIARGVRRGSASVLFQMLGRSTPVEMPVEQLEKVA